MNSLKLYLTLVKGVKLITKRKNSIIAMGIISIRALFPTTAKITRKVARIRKEIAVNRPKCFCFLMFTIKKSTIGASVNTMNSPVATQ